MKDIIEIEKQVDEMSRTVFGDTFKYRPHQKETIVDILYNWLNGTSNIILSAPTGSGKSIVALSVASVLTKYYNKKGYILISDLSLLEQYKKDVDVYFPDWSLLKGQQTYMCNANGLNFKVGACKLAGCTNYGEIKVKYSDCASTCEYIIEREKAIASPVTICTYAFWLIQQNNVKPKMIEMGAPVPFDDRDFVICDEGHKLLDIVQQQFAPKLIPDDLSRIKSIIVESKVENSVDLFGDINKSRESIFGAQTNDDVLSGLKDYVDKLSTIVDMCSKIKEKYKGIEHLSKNERGLIYNCDFIEEHVTKLCEYIHIIEKMGTEYIVKNDSDDHTTMTLNCINETYLMEKFFHKHCKLKMYMSATIGDPVVYATDIAATNYKSIELPPVFDYTKSPIFYVDGYKMSYSQKETSFPRIIELIEGVFELYPNFRGIIQTGSYAFAKRLKENISYKYKDRLLLYDDSNEKNESLDVYKLSDNKVLVGPSLVEGLSLDDDLCRFQIIMKVPYPSLADKFVKAKLDFNEQWYSNSTSISILQGVGRGVRNENDWCITFIFDGCFKTLLNKSYNMFPKDFINRIQVISPYTIIKQN